MNDFLVIANSITIGIEKTAASAISRIKAVRRFQSVRQVIHILVVGGACIAAEIFSTDDLRLGLARTRPP